MTKNEILQLAQEIARDLVTSTDATMSAYYDEVVEELGKTLDPPLVEAALFPFTSGTATYAYPTAAIEILHLFFTGYPLPLVPEETLEAYSKTWRSASGSPRAYLCGQETSRYVRIYPTPDTTSTALDPLATEPLGDDFPANSGAVIYSDSRESGISDMLGCYIAFQVLYKEFIRPSSHQDAEWALLLKQVAEVFYILGVIRHGPRRRPLLEKEGRTTEAA